MVNPERVPNGSEHNFINAVLSRNEQEVRRILGVPQLILRRTKEEWLTLPSLNIAYIVIPPTKKQEEKLKEASR